MIELAVFVVKRDRAAAADKPVSYLVGVGQFSYALEAFKLVAFVLLDDIVVATVYLAQSFGLVPGEYLYRHARYAVDITVGEPVGRHVGGEVDIRFNFGVGKFLSRIELIAAKKGHGKPRRVFPELRVAENLQRLNGTGRAEADGKRRRLGKRIAFDEFAVCIPKFCILGNFRRKACAPPADYFGVDESASAG